METFEQHFSTWTGTAAMREAIIAELEGLPNDNGDWSSPILSKEWHNHRWGGGIVWRLHYKNWNDVIDLIKKCDPEFYARYAKEAPFYRNYQEILDGCPAEFPILSKYLAMRKAEVEVYAPNQSIGLFGMTWGDKVEGDWRGDGSFWSNVHQENYPEANRILRKHRPDLYDFDARYHFASSILQDLDADTAEAILYGAVSIDQVIDRINALAQ
jgi:hypothetical protein